MKTLLTFVLALALLCSSASSETVTWNSAEVMTTISGSAFVSELISLEASLVRYESLDAPVNDTASEQVFFYAGFDAHFCADAGNRTLSIGPRVGFAAHWYPETSLLIALYANYNESEVFNFFVEADWYHYKRQRDYYGFYSLDYSFGWNRAWFVGASLEQVNREVWYGPKVGRAFGEHLTMEFTGWYYPQPDMVGARVGVTLAF